MMSETKSVTWSEFVADPLRGANQILANQITDLKASLSQSQAREKRLQAIVDMARQARTFEFKQAVKNQNGLIREAVAYAVPIMESYQQLDKLLAALDTREATHD